MENLTAREREILDRLDAELSVGPVAETPPPLLEQIAAAAQTPSDDIRSARLGEMPVDSARLSHGDGGFPPVDGAGPTYGGRRPGRRAQPDIPTWLALLLIWLAVAAAYVVDPPEQRDADRLLMLLILVGGTVSILGTTRLNPRSRR